MCPELDQLVVMNSGDVVAELMGSVGNRSDPAQFDRLMEERQPSFEVTGGEGPLGMDAQVSLEGVALIARHANERP